MKVSTTPAANYELFIYIAPFGDFANFGASRLNISRYFSLFRAGGRNEKLPSCQRRREFLSARTYASTGPAAADKTRFGLPVSVLPAGDLHHQVEKGSSVSGGPSPRRQDREKKSEESTSLSRKGIEAKGSRPAYCLLFALLRRCEV